MQGSDTPEHLHGVERGALRCVRSGNGSWPHGVALLLSGGSNGLLPARLPAYAVNANSMIPNELVPAELEVRGGKNGRVIGAGSTGWGLRHGV